MQSNFPAHHILRHTLSSTLTSVTFLWILGHINLPEHDAVDHTTKQSLQSRSVIDPSLVLAYPPTTPNYSTAPSSTTPGINSGIPFPPINSDLIKKNLFPGLLQIKLFVMKKFFSTGSELDYTPHPLLPLSRSLHSSLLSILSKR